jgi:hypothetical protein
MSKTASEKSNGKTTPKNKGKKIYITEHAWYYENDPFDKEKIEAAKQLLKKINFSQFLADRAAFEQQAEHKNEQRKE